jgi:hypothetical protein
VHASHAHLLFFDNVSSFSAKDADRLCTLSTGANSSNRKHHTMDEEFRFTLVRPIVVTTISTPSTRNDLLSRSLRVNALDLGGRFRSEKEVWREFEADRPKMFGLLLRAMSESLKNTAIMIEARDQGLIKHGRMGDSALFVEGAATVLGMQVGEFSALCAEDQLAIQADAVSGNPMVEGIVALLSRPGVEFLDVTATELLARLREVSRYAEWPATNQVAGYLSKVSPGLSARGVKLTKRTDRHKKVNRFELRREADFEPADLNLPGERQAEPEPF